MPREKHDRPDVRTAAIRSASAAFEISMVILPIWLLLLRHGMPDFVHSSWAVAAVFASILTASLSEWLRSWWISLGAALVIGAGAVWLTGPDETSYMGAVLLIAAFLQGSTVHLRSRHFAWPWAGVAVYFAVSAIAQFRTDWSGLTGAMAVLGTLHLAVALYLAHDRNIRDITLSDQASQRVPREMKRQIRIYAAVLLFAMLALAAGLGGFIVHLLRNTAAAVIAWLLDLFESTSEEIPEEPPVVQTPQMPPDAGEPSQFSNILNAIFYGVAILLILALVYWMLTRLYRNRRDIWDRWAALLRKWLRIRPRTAQGTTGYVDEETSLFSWEETLNRMRKNRLGRLFMRQSEQGYDDLPDNRAKVRFLYRKWLRSLVSLGYKVQPNLTPEELLADAESWQHEHKGQVSKRRQSELTHQDEQALVELYYQARYRDREPADEQLNRVRGKR